MPLKPKLPMLRLRMGCGETLVARAARPLVHLWPLRPDARRAVGHSGRSKR
jgi:hypothetical protein